MPQVKHKDDDPIDPVSFSSVWRTTLALLECFRDRPAPTCAFLFAVAFWIAGINRIIWPELIDPVSANVNLTRDVLYDPAGMPWRRYVLHAFWPLESGYIRGFFLSSMLLIQGYTLEYEVGTTQFVLLLLGLHAVSGLILLYFQLVLYHVSLEPALVALCMVMHRINPKVHTDGLDKSLRVPFQIEPRWHLWFLQASLLLLAEDFPTTLLIHAVGLFVGGCLALRDPEVWLDGWRAGRERSFGIGAPVHIALLLFTLLFMPLTAPAWPKNFLYALVDGSALQRSWWSTAFPGSQPLLHLAMFGMLSMQAYLICKLLIAFAFPLLLSPFRMWTKFYAGACVLLIMYSMNSSVWQVPHIGFVTLWYLAWSLWKLTGLESAHYHRA